MRENEIPTSTSSLRPQRPYVGRLITMGKATPSEPGRIISVSSGQSSRLGERPSYLGDRRARLGERRARLRDAISHAMLL